MLNNKVEIDNKQEKINKLEKKAILSVLNLTEIVNTNKLIEDKELLGQNPVYKTVKTPYAIVMQSTFMAKEEKESKYVSRVLTHNFQKSKNVPDYYTVAQKESHFKLIENGVTSMFRQVITVDIDYIMQDVYELYQILGNLPFKEIVITQNKDTGHYQLHFYLKNPLKIRDLDWNNTLPNGKIFPKIIRNEDTCETYMKITKLLASYFIKKGFKGVDLAYQGTMCRNPFADSQISYIYKNGSLNLLENEKPNGYNIEELFEIVNKEHIKIRKNTNVEPTKTDLEEFGNSRHWLTLYYGRNYMFCNMTSDNSPNLLDLQDYLLSVKEEIGNLCGKCPHDDREIIAQAKSIFDWCIKNYNKGRHGDGKGSDTSKQWTSSIYWNEKQRVGKIKRANRYRKLYRKLRNAGKTISKIAEMLEMTRRTLYSYLELFVVMDKVKTRLDYNNHKIFMPRDWTDIIEDITNKIKLLKMKFGNSKIKWKNIELEDTDDNSVYWLPYKGYSDSELYNTSCCEICA